MNKAQLQTLLDFLVASWESEVIEFKQATNDYPTNKIGQYFSALANEANLRNAEKAWLVFGVSDKTGTVVGSDYRIKENHLQSVKMQISDDTEPSVTFRNIFELQHLQGRVVLFEVPPAPRGMPIAWKGHYYARSHESLTNLGLDKLDAIREQTIASDWSAQIVTRATLDHLDQSAVEKARESFSQKYANRFPFEEVMDWPLETFLGRAKLIQDGNLTRTTLLLLGKPEAAHFLSPHPAQLTWKLEGPERAYEHFGPPFFMSTTALYQKIRNHHLRILPEDTLLALEVSKYDQKVVLEALHNCIAHQDYTRNGRILVTEQPNKLIFENEGGFFEGKPVDYVIGDKTPRSYRNSFLTQAMTELNMIDTMGYGIHEMHKGQARRYFPMPDYDIQDPAKVKMTVYGSVVDPAYSRLLMQRTNLSLLDILHLDRVQKKLPLSDATILHLRRSKLIRGRKPNLHVSVSVDKAAASNTDNTKTRTQDDTYYAKLITDYLRKFGKTSRKDIKKLLWGKLSDTLDDKQKDNKIGNLLTNLRRAGRIRNAGSRKSPQWMIAE